MPAKKPRPPQQLDLFGETPTRGKPPRLVSPPPPAPESALQESRPTSSEREVITSLTDDALLEPVGSGPMRLRLAVIEEVGRRRSAGAIPALARVCRLFMGYGAEEMIPEQIAAVEAIAAIGGHGRPSHLKPPQSPVPSVSMSEQQANQALIEPLIGETIDAAATGTLAQRQTNDLTNAFRTTSVAGASQSWVRAQQGRMERILDIQQTARTATALTVDPHGRRRAIRIVSPPLTVLFARGQEYGTIDW